MRLTSVRTSGDRKRLETFDVTSGVTLQSCASKGTEIVQLLPIGPNTVVREDYYKFPRGVSNVYCVDSQLQTIWEAELPHPTDAYANPVVMISQGVLQCASWDCFTCDLDLETGKLIKQRFTK